MYHPTSWTLDTFGGYPTRQNQRRGTAGMNYDNTSSLECVHDSSLSHPAFAGLPTDGVGEDEDETSSEPQYMGLDPDPDMASDDDLRK